MEKMNLLFTQSMHAKVLCVSRISCVLKMTPMLKDTYMYSECLTKEIATIPTKLLKKNNIAAIDLFRNVILGFKVVLSQGTPSPSQEQPCR